MALFKEDKGDAGENSGTEYTILPGDIFLGRLDPDGDNDWIRVELTAGTAYDITLIRDPGLNPVTLLDSEGNIFSSAQSPSGPPTDSILTFNPAVSGVYYISVGSRFQYITDYEISVAENPTPIGTYDELAEYLSHGYWEGNTRQISGIESGDVLTANITALTGAGQQLARWALDSWTRVTGIEFEFVAGRADLHFTVDRGTIASGGFGRVNVPISYLNSADPMIGSSAFSTFIHETGHALGLGHPGPYNEAAVIFGDDNIFLIDSGQATVMTYFDQTRNTFINASRASPITAMSADIIAIQNLYGKPVDINAGDNVYGYNSNVDGYLGEFFLQWAGNEENPLAGLIFGSPGNSVGAIHAFADLDGDNDPDLVLLGLRDRFNAFYYYENTGTTANPAFTLRTEGANPLDDVYVGGSSASSFADLDDDGDLDLVVGTQRNGIHYFENTGTPDNPEFTKRAGMANPVNGVNDIAISLITPAFTDLDNDGDPDLVIGEREGILHYFENTGTPANPNFINRTGDDNPLDGIDVGFWSTPTFFDLDSDSDPDLVIGEQNGIFHYFENTGSPHNPDFTQRTGPANPLDDVYVSGGLIAATFADLDDDGDPDLVIAGGRGTIHYSENTGSRTDPVFNTRIIRINHSVTLTLYDNDGNDTLDLRRDPSDQRVDLRPEGISDVYGLVGNLVIARDTLIENFIAGFGNDAVIGNMASNHLEGRDGDDELRGNEGNDVLEGGAGADRLDGGAGLDWVSYAGSDTAVTVRLRDGFVGRGHAEGDTLSNFENVRGSAHGDILGGNHSANHLDGGAGNDGLWGSGGDDVLEGGAGADRLYGGTGTDWASYQGSDAGVTVNLGDGTVSGGHAEGDEISDIENLLGSAYRDILIGDGGVNDLDGGAGDDELRANEGDDVLKGNEGNDVLEGGAGADRLDGGAGLDWVSYAGSDTAVTVRLRDGFVGRGHAEGDSISNLENVRGSAYGDILGGNHSANHLDGGAGNDGLWGSGGDDVLEGGAGADRLYGGTGTDWASYQGSDAGVTVNLGDGTVSGGHAEGDEISDIENLLGSAYRDILIGDGGVNDLDGGAGDDELRGNEGDDVLEGGAGADRLDGGAGLDWVSYAGSNTAVTVRLRDGFVGRGHAEGDSISNFENVRGSAHGDILGGNHSANHLDGGAGNDGLWGSGGDDVLEGGAGADRLYGGTGTDWASYQGSDAGVTVNLGDGTVSGGHAEGDEISDIENLLGSAYRDILIGDGGVNDLDGGAGDDELQGNEGDDVLEGDVGSDRLYGGNGADRLDGGVGHDELWGDDGDDVLEGNLGFDQLYGGAGADRLDGGVGRDELWGDDGDDVLEGGVGADLLYGGPGSDRMNGGNGDDKFWGDNGGDILDGGAGIDQVSYLASDTGVTVNLADGVGEGGHAEGDMITNIENVTGSDYGDVLKGDDDANHLDGGVGDDELHGNGGADILVGGAGADRLDGGGGVDSVSYRDSEDGITVNLAAGTGMGGHAEGDMIIDVENVRGSEYADSLTGDGGRNHLEGGGGDDNLSSSDGADHLDGGTGRDRIIYWRSNAGVTINLDNGTGEGGHAEGDTFSDVENVFGSNHGDMLIGDDNSNHLDGSHGNDQLWGKDGDDILVGNFGDDQLYGGDGDDGLYDRQGADLLDGGPGTDNISYNGSNAGVMVNLMDGIVGGGSAEGDVIMNIENVQGSHFRDILIGDDGANRLSGIHGDDELWGHGGNDVLHGNGGADRLEGGDGDDELYGSTGEDLLYGDDGVDRLLGGHGDDQLWGGDGDDILDGEVGNDQLQGGNGEDILFGDGGDDELRGGAGDDSLFGQDDADLMFGGDGNDWLNSGNGDDELWGGPGDDRLWGGAGADRLDGGSGIDWVHYRFSSTGVTVDLRDGTATGNQADGDEIVNIENVEGSDNVDVLIGDDGANQLFGLNGDDDLRGGGGDDLLFGDEGADRLDGGDGVDTVSYRWSRVGVAVNLEDGSTGTIGYARGDVIINVENITGSYFDDKLSGDAGANRLEGSEGRDELQGNDGDDVLVGGAGGDRLHGGVGADVFLFEPGHGIDTVFDFTDDDDRIDLTAFGLSGFDSLDISQVSNGVRIDLSDHDGRIILLEGFDIANLDASDFIF